MKNQNYYDNGSFDESDDFLPEDLDIEEELDDIILDEDSEQLNDALGYDEGELERRRVAYKDLKKTDKIFNNTYNVGFETNDEDDDPRKTNSAAIRIDAGAAEYSMYDPRTYAEHVDLKIVQRDIHEFMVSNDVINSILSNDPEKKKFTKIEINSLFETLKTGLITSSNHFISPIHILDSISTSTNMEYKKIFDMLTYENKEILLIELNKSYNILDSMGKNYKMF